VPDIAANLAAIRLRLDASARAAGRAPSDVRLVAVSKTFPIESIRAAAAAGQIAFGENRVQEALGKVDAMRDLALEWHLVGHLQTNKARRAAVAFQWIHSIDSLDLLQKVDAAAADAGTRPFVLLQVDLAHEETKFGADETVLLDLSHAAVHAKAVRLSGLMTVPPISERPEDARPWFRRLRDLRDRLVASGIDAAHLRELSMGMSHDFEVAIDEGATMVRIGTAIFGRRTPPGVAAAP
jgi:pyridoxal phosphate enzyme (YggS family)